MCEKGKKESEEGGGGGEDHFLNVLLLGKSANPTNQKKVEKKNTCNSDKKQGKTYLNL